MHYTNYHESKQRGTSDFPIEFYHVIPNHPQYHMRIHWHMEFEFIRILEGSFLLSMDEQDFLLSQGDMAFIPSGTLHAGMPKDNCIYDCIVLDPNMLLNNSSSICKYIRQIMNGELILPSVYTANDKELLPLISSLFDAISERVSGYQLIVQGALYQFFGKILASNNLNETPAKTKRDLKRIMQLKHALEYIESSYASPITLQEISESVQMTPKYFCRFFREMTHRSPIDYVNYYRIDRACHLLLTTNQSITEIAYNTGFNDLSYFIKLFKRYKGVTPKQYLR